MEGSRRAGDAPQRVQMKLTSAFGAFLDPVADKLMVATVLILLAVRDQSAPPRPAASAPVLLLGAGTGAVPVGGRKGPEAFFAIPSDSPHSLLSQDLGVTERPRGYRSCHAGALKQQLVRGRFARRRRCRRRT